MNLFCVGLSHHTATVETRERYGCGLSASALRQASGCREMLLLTTCNRVEVYAASEESVSTETIRRQLRQQAPGGAEEDAGVFYRLEGSDCVRHLFRVACGFDSMVVGESEILGQAKKAYAEARQAGSAGPLLHRLFQRGFRVAKQVRTRTDITRGAVSVGSVAVDLAGKIFGDLTRCKVLLLGAGENSERTARALVSRGVCDLRVTNRTGERAANLAALVNGRSIPFTAWQEECREIDILISSTAATEPIVTREILQPIVRARRARPLFLIDIAVPRDVAPEVNEMEGVYLYDMDSLQAIADESLALRRRQIAAGEAIIEEHVTEFCDWLNEGRGRGPRAERNEVPLSDASLRSPAS